MKRLSISILLVSVLVGCTSNAVVPAWLIERNDSDSIRTLSRLRKGRDDLRRRGGWFSRRPDTWPPAQAFA